MKYTDFKAPNRRDRRTSRAFTLVELLVTIGIICVLMAILLPVLNRSREQARTLNCLANLRQLGAAVMAYVQQNDGSLLPAGYATDQTTHDNREYWSTVLARSGVIPIEYPRSTSDNVVTRGVLWCPSSLLEVANFSSATIPNSPTDARGATYTRIQSTQWPGIIVDSSYGINGTTTSGKTTYAPTWRVPPDSTSTTADYSMPSLSKLKRVSEIALFFDGIYMNLSLNPNRLNGRHNNSKATNISFYDGHAETFTRDILPQAASDYNSAATLNTKYPRPVWRTDQ
jgi:prepilin-type N-terminal cleavage/methylation domain-containing protein/prepilin-type processing-associated H-X9-DG protein